MGRPNRKRPRARPAQRSHEFIPAHTPRLSQPPSRSFSLAEDIGGLQSLVIDGGVHDDQASSIPDSSSRSRITTGNCSDTIRNVTNLWGGFNVEDVHTAAPELRLGVDVEVDGTGVLWLLNSSGKHARDASSIKIAAATHTTLATSTIDTERGKANCSADIPNDFSCKMKRTRCRRCVTEYSLAAFNAPSVARAKAAEEGSGQTAVTRDRTILFYGNDARTPCHHHKDTAEGHNGERKYIESTRNGTPQTVSYAGEEALRVELSRIKAEFDEIPPTVFKRTRSACNPAEALGSGPFLNRSAMKLANIDAVVGLLSSPLVQPSSTAWRQCNAAKQASEGHEKEAAGTTAATAAAAVVACKSDGGAESDRDGGGHDEPRQYCPSAPASSSPSRQGGTREGADNGQDGQEKQGVEACEGHKPLPLSFADLCGGPGGFSEYIFRRRRQQGLSARGWGISLCQKGNEDELSYPPIAGSERVENIIDIPSSRQSTTISKDKDVQRGGGDKRLREVMACGIGALITRSRGESGNDRDPCAWRLDNLAPWCDVWTTSGRSTADGASRVDSFTSTTAATDINGATTAPLPSLLEMRIDFGPSGTGDLTDEDNLFGFVDAVLASAGDRRLDLVVADGGFAAARDDEEQERLVTPLVYAEVLTALLLLEEGGTLVCKVFELWTEPMVSLVYLLHVHFRRIAIMKPITSRPASGERYLVCTGLLSRMSPECHAANYLRNTMRPQAQQQELCEQGEQEDIRRQQQLGPSEMPARAREGTETNPVSETGAGDIPPTGGRLHVDRPADDRPGATRSLGATPVAGIGEVGRTSVTLRDDPEATDVRDDVDYSASCTFGDENHGGVRADDIEGKWNLESELRKDTGFVSYLRMMNDRLARLHTDACARIVEVASSRRGRAWAFRDRTGQAYGNSIFVYNGEDRTEDINNDGRDGRATGTAQDEGVGIWDGCLERGGESDAAALERFRRAWHLKGL